MTLRWGVDSSFYHADRVVSMDTGRVVGRLNDPQYATVNDRLPQDQGTLYDYIADQIRAPEFWGRYINWGETSHAAGKRLRSEEIRYIFQRSARGGTNCKILIIYNGIRGQGGCQTRGRQGYHTGWMDAWKACAYARNIGVPAGVRIYGNIEGRWLVSRDWLRGWWDFMDRTEFAGLGGLYGRPAELGPYRDQLRRAMEKDFLPHARMYPPGRFSMNISRARKERWASQTPRPPVKTFSDQFHIWSNTPKHECSAAANDIPTGFFAVGPMNATTVIWQYGYECMRGYVDMNIATEQGYNDMWAG